MPQQAIDPRWQPVPATAVDPRWQPVEEPPPAQPSAVERFGSNLAQNLLPSTTPSDYIEGPAYATQHPMDAVGLILRALWDAHAAQAGKTLESAKGIISDPTMAGKMGALSETLGHGAATILPMVGPAAANAGEQLGSGDIAGGLGAATGLLIPSAVSGVRGTAPAKWAAGKLHESAIGQVQKAINPTRVSTKVQTARIAPEMLERRVKAGSLQKLEQLAEGESAKAGVKVDEALQPHMRETTDTMALVDELEKSKADYVGTAEDGRRIINDKDRVGAIQKLQDTLMEYGDKISVESRVKLRRNWDRIVNDAKGFVTEDVNNKGWAAREGRSVLRENLKADVPDLAAMNADYSFWQTLEDVAHASNERKVGQKGNLVSAVAGGAGAIAAEVAMPGAGMVKGGLQAALGAQLFSSLRKLIDSPGYQMWSAVQKEKLADALIAKDSARVRGLVHQGLVSASSGSRRAGQIRSGQPMQPAADNDRIPRDQRAKR